MPHYNVQWEIEVDAASPEAAAQAAWDAMRRPGSTANVFDVYDEHGECTRVDLQEIDESNSHLNDIDYVRKVGERARET